MTKAESTFREEFERQALQARRRMVRTGELLPPDEFCLRLEIDDKRLTRLVAQGSVFSVEVDSTDYFPALLADTTHDLKRLWAICRILVPAEPMSRLHYLTSRRNNLGAITPLQAMRTDKGYTWLRAMAKAFAAEWSRTTVEIYVGQYTGDVHALQLVCSAVEEIDPRISVWRRASAALHSTGNIRPAGPYPRASVATVLVLRSTAAGPQDVTEMRLDIVVKKNLAEVSVARPDAPSLTLESVTVTESDDIFGVVLKIVAAACANKELRVRM